MKLPVDLTYASPEDPILKQKMVRTIEAWSGKRKIERLYEKIDDRHGGKASFFTEAFKQLQIEIEYDQKQLAKIPQEGPLVILANHPFGVLDGMFLSFMGAVSRKNWGILVYDKYCEVDHLSSNFLPISFEKTTEGRRMNMRTMRNALSLLKKEGAIVIFPAGGISTADGTFGPVTDIEWQPFVAKLIQASQATVVPVYFHGHNSRLFHFVSQFSPTLRLALIIHELRNKIGKSIQVTIGDPIAYQQLPQTKERDALVQYLRQHTYNLVDHQAYIGKSTHAPTTNDVIDLMRKIKLSY